MSRRGRDRGKMKWNKKYSLNSHRYYNDGLRMHFSRFDYNLFFRRKKYSSMNEERAKGKQIEYTEQWRNANRMCVCDL